MKGTHATIDRPAMPADILAWLQADYRIRAGVDPEVISGETLTAETTIEEWRLICDLVDTWQLGNCMNDWFGASRPTREWRNVLEPENRRTLGDLATYVAPHVRLPDFRPIRIAGAEDPATGAFFCLRNLIARADPRAASFRPSTPIADVARDSFIPLGEALVRLAPQVTQEPTITLSERQRTGDDMFAEGWLCLILGAALQSLWLIAVGPLLIVAGVFAARGGPERVALGPYVTLGDLSRAIASYGVKA